MKCILPNYQKGTFLFVLLMLLAGNAMAQQFVKGVRQGVIKVKFTQGMTGTLSQMNVQARSNKLTTGISSVDEAAVTTKAKNMYRLFPYDVRHEAKLRKHGLHLWYVVEIDANTDPKAAIAVFERLPEVEVAELDREKKLQPYTVKPYTPGVSAKATLPFNDPMLADQWHYENSGNTGYPNGADVNLFSAWQTTAGHRDIIVSIHDEGVDVKHKDLAANLWVNTAEQNGVPGVDDDGNGYIDDVHGWNFDKRKGAIDAQYHGTHVAGTIAAVNNNGIGVSGVAGGTGNNDGVRVMSLQILGGGSIENSFIYAANNGAVISQNSWGYTATNAYEQSVMDAINYFIDEAGDYTGSPMRGGIVIFAAGNSNFDGAWYPGYYDRILSVSALGPDWKKASYSNYGTWVDIAAPGGEIELGSKNGILSTAPQDKYAYMEGTSMACPHVSGIAALALANRTRQITNAELWNKLVTGVVSIDEHNETYLGKLGSGAIDATLAIQNDRKLAPEVITTLAVTGISQEFANVQWTVPADEDDVQPVSFQLYYHTATITTSNLSQATKIVIKNTKAAGSVQQYEVGGLLGLTSYHFAITSTDRWGNVSELSNVANATTNDGPSISIDEASQNIAIDIDAAVATTGDHTITLSNNASGILRWNHFMRHKNTEVAFSAAGIQYPKVGTKTKAGVSIGRVQTHYKKPAALNTVAPTAFTSIDKQYTAFPTNIIGETDLALTNSAAAKFFVTETDGFNLTDVWMYLKHNPELGPVVVEIYKGNVLQKNNLVYAQEHNNYDGDETNALITLNEQLYFQQGEVFWVVFHVPAGNLFPLGIGYELDPSYSDNCFMSFNLGNIWMPLSDALGSKEFAWSVNAVSNNKHLGTYLALEPASGDVAGNGSSEVILTANGSQLVNGAYQANMIITSNDANQRELRVPVTVNVSGHKPVIQHIDIVDFGSVFQGTEKTIDVTFSNTGYGNFNDPVFSVSGNQFEIKGSTPWQLKAREQVVVTIAYKPNASGNANGVLTLTNGDQTYSVALFGVGAETSKIKITPETQTVNNVAIGDVVNAQITVENTGAYPLKYFIPGFDAKGVSNNWPSDYHTYGYKLRTNYGSEANPIAYAFQNIKATGVNITQQIPDRGYYTLDMGFQFPFYNETMSTIYIASGGFTTFDNSVSSINNPSIPGNEWTPKGYISPLGSGFSYLTQGEVYYQAEADRIIIQYDNVTDGWSGTTTTQMVLFSNGDIRFYYDELSIPSVYLNVLIEDMAQQDGIVINNYDHEIEMYSGLALGLDYPGPGIITEVVNGSGVVLPGASAVVDVTLNTTSLAEGIVNRYINFISNDPANNQQSALIQLEVNSGGVAQAALSTEAIAFGDVFQGAVKKQILTLKNPGTANLSVTGIAFANSAFTFTGDQPTVIKPGLYKRYEVTIPTNTIASLSDELVITYAGGETDKVTVTGNVVPAPAIAVDLSTLTATLNYGETSSHPFVIENTGEANMEVAATGTEWLTFNVPIEPASTSVVPDFTYVVEKNNDGSKYQWIDIRKEGTQLPFMGNDFESTFWRELELPFAISFYGQAYSSVKIGDNGILSFEEDPLAMFFTENIPSPSHPGACIMPYWTFSGFSDYLYDIEDIGIFYKFYDDKIIITWSYFTNNFGGMGDPVSAQVIFYKNGTMKFQYKAEEGGADFTSRNSIIGLQRDNETGVVISAYTGLDYGSGLAYIVKPAQRYIVAPGATLAGEIKLDARNVYGGVYTDALTINTNVPNQEILSKPVELTVVGEAIPEIPEAISFEGRMIMQEFGSPKQYTIDFEIGNTGSAPYEISWIEMADGMQGLTLQLEQDGFWGKMWTNISEIYSPWAGEIAAYSIKPGDQLKVRAVFAPEAASDFADEAVFTTTAGELRLALTGTGVEPPVLEVNATAIEVLMNTIAEQKTQSIAFNNVAGKSALQYEVSIEYGRVTTAMPTEVMATAVSGKLISDKAKQSQSLSVRPYANYNRVIKHSDKETPDTFVGTGGTADFTLATKFNSGNQSFNISHVETFFRREELTNGTIDVEVRTGGTSITDATVLASGTVNFSGTEADESGSWLQIALDQPAVIFPNEDFYVVVTYPFGIKYPQGTLAQTTTSSNRYLYYNEGAWYDIQQEGGEFTTAGWLMYAAEQTPAEGSWISVTSSTEGALAEGESSSIELKFDGAFASRGTQQASIVLTSNDPVKPSVKIPVSLHLNEAPKFSNVPDAIIVAEGAKRTLIIPVTDGEGHTFTIQPAATYAGVSHTLANNTLTIVLQPGYATAGNHTYKFVATDAHAATRELVLYVEVTHTNRAPAYTGTALPEFLPSARLEEFSIDNFFSDPDNDAMTFTARSLNENLVQVYVSSDKFLIKALGTGETKLAFVVTDSHGASVKDTLDVQVGIVLNAEQGVSNGVMIYPNPVRSNTLQLKFGNEWNGVVNISITDATGRSVLHEEVVAAEITPLKISTLEVGIYIVHAEQNGKQATLKLIREK